MQLPQNASEAFTPTMNHSSIFASLAKVFQIPTRAAGSSQIVASLRPTLVQPTQIQQSSGFSSTAWLGKRQRQTTKTRERRISTCPQRFIHSFNTSWEFRSVANLPQPPSAGPSTTPSATSPVPSASPACAPCATGPSTAPGNCGSASSANRTSCNWKGSGRACVRRPKS